MTRTIDGQPRRTRKLPARLLGRRTETAAVPDPGPVPPSRPGVAGATRRPLPPARPATAAWTTAQAAEPRNSEPLRALAAALEAVAATFDGAARAASRQS